MTPEQPPGNEVTLSVLIGGRCAVADIASKQPYEPHGASQKRWSQNELSVFQSPKFSPIKEATVNGWLRENTSCGTASLLTHC
jgi:hypothetical protein